MFPSSYALIHSALASHVHHSVVVYTSMDRVNFDAHPSPIYGSHSITDLSMVLPEVNTTFAIQVSNPFTRRVIDLAPCRQGEVDLDPGLSVRVVDDPRDLCLLPHYEAVFIRMDGSLVIWGDVEDTTLGFWREIIWRIQSPAIPTTTSVAGPSVYSGFNPDGTTLGNELSGLDEFFNLSTFADLPPGPWGADYEATTSTHPPLGCQPVTSAPSEGSLGFAFPQRSHSPFSDATTASSLVNSPSTADLEHTFPSYAPQVYFGEEFDLDFSFSIGDRGVSPALSSSHCTVAGFPNSTSPVPMKASGSSSSLQYSVVEANSPWSFAHGFDQIAPREVEEARHHLQKLTIGSASDTATGNADVDLPSASNTRVPKRSHSVFASGSVSAPARLTIPLPDVEYIQPEDNKRRKFFTIAPALLQPEAPPASAPSFTFTFTSTSTSTSTHSPALAPAPIFLSQPPPAPEDPQSPPAPEDPQPPPAPEAPQPPPAPEDPQPPPAPEDPQPPPPGNHRRRGRRHPCDYCHKTFSRKQDRDRHTTTSCNASPRRETVECPECGSILSRLDAAQRHWRQHENPKCPTPEWASSRRY